uniref:Ig-like domain-containing protein n=1 Tax=Lates calcarifer TaxID=8187 RepID=A0A4W6CMS3_LATCA
MGIIKHGLLSSLVFVDVTQTSILWKKEGDNATIECSHTKGVSYNRMYWYRQLPGQTMRQVVLSIANTKPTFEPDFTDEKFSVTKPNAETGTFTVKNLVPEDKGLYFCAVSEHSDTDTCES